MQRSDEDFKDAFVDAYGTLLSTAIGTAMSSPPFPFPMKRDAALIYLTERAVELDVQQPREDEIEHVYVLTCCALGMVEGFEDDIRELMAALEKGDPMLGGMVSQ